MKTLKFLLAVLFLCFASLQYNDPDPYVWIPIYGAMAAVCIMSAFGFYVRWLMIIQFIGYITYCIILVPGLRQWLASPDRSLLFDEMAKMQFLYIEESREFLGLVICLVVLVWIWFLSQKERIKA